MKTRIYTAPAVKGLSPSLLLAGITTILSCEGLKSFGQIDIPYSIPITEQAIDSNIITTSKLYTYY